jgi:molybdate transport system substrate-binding protein
MIGKALLFLFPISLFAGCSGFDRESAGGSVAPRSSAKTELLISAAVSMRNSLEEIGSIFQKKYPEISLVYSFGGSGSLRRQIENGAPVDLFISADTEHMDALIRKGLISPSWRRDLVSNRLAVIVPAHRKSSARTIQELTSYDYRTFAVGDPELVPVGKYAKEALQSAGIWDELKERLVFAKDARQVAAFVENISYLHVNSAKSLRLMSETSNPGLGAISFFHS